MWNRCLHFSHPNECSKMVLSQFCERMEGLSDQLQETGDDLASGLDDLVVLFSTISQQRLPDVLSRRCGPNPCK
jgi:hypothetical protein